LTPGLALLVVLGMAAPPAGPSSPAATTAEAERLAAEALALAPRDAAGAASKALRAVSLSSEFEPTAFVRPGRKGEVVEDAFQQARAEFRQHRARVYEAAGRVLSAAGQPMAASRYLRRSFFLDPTPDRGLALAHTLNELGQGREALATVQEAISGLVSLKPEAAEVVARAADVARLPSAQAEIDRGRLKATLGSAVTLREGPFELPAGVRLSTTPVFRLDEAPITVIYGSEASCRSCSADLEALARQVPPEGVRVLALPPGDDQDQALRQVLSLYRRPWPLLLGRDLAAKIGVEPRSLLVVARGGWLVAVLKAPFGAELGTALESLQRQDVQETVPRPRWNRRPVDRSPLPPPPGLLPEGLAPGEDRPFPAEFEALVTAFREGRYAEARGLVDSLEARGDGWLLPPEARLDRALCLAAGGRKDAARRILLRTGDSRFEGEIDRLLETVAAR
jgi:hypothetical protein